MDHQIEAASKPFIAPYDCSTEAIERRLLNHSKLCESCKRITQIVREFPLEAKIIQDVHHATPSALESAATQGCRLCNPLWEAYQHWLAATEDPGLNTGDRQDFCEKEAYKMITNKAYLFSFRLNVSNVSLHYKVQRVEVHAFQQVGSFGDSTSSDACFDLAKRWLRNCETNHEMFCSQSSPRAYSPTRLIKIYRRGADYQLHLSANHSRVSKIEYLTLSHRWGPRPSLTLTKSNINLWSNDVPFRDLPRTFQDAVIATNQLGFDYLWIDALCIVQDSKEDWYKEASAMSDVYTNSVCNLSALHAHGDSDGMFSARKSEENYPIVSALTSRKQPSNLLHIEPVEDWDNQITRKALNRRGWVVQERLLAPRILYFGKAQLFWECNNLQASELVPNGTVNIKPWPNLAARVNWEYKTKDDIVGNNWEDIIAMYSASNLSVSSDKLVAISGIARVLGTASKDDYCAGLWKSNFMQQLTWNIIDGAGVRPSIYRAPSWSWASVDGQVEFTGLNESHNFALVESVDVTTVTEDAFGAVKDAILRLRGQLYPADCGIDEEYRHLAAQTLGLACLPNGRVLNKKILDSEHDPIPGNLCYVPIMCFKDSDVAFFMSLILKPSNRDGAYERVGLLKTWCSREEGSKHTRTNFPDFQSYQEKNHDRLSEQIITIV